MTLIQEFTAQVTTNVEQVIIGKRIGLFLRSGAAF
jgi:hypothetical protein